MLYTISPDPSVLSVACTASQLVYRLREQAFNLLGSVTSVNIQHESEYASANPKRNFISLDFPAEQLASVQKELNAFVVKPSYILYKISDKKDRLILDVDQNLDITTYKEVFKTLTVQFNVPLIKSHADIRKIIKCQPISDEDVIEYHTGMPYPLSTQNVMNNEQASKLAPDQQKLAKATLDFLKTDRANKILHDRTLATKFLDSLATSLINKQITNSYLNATVKKIAEITKYDLSNWQNLMNERIRLLNNSPELRESAEPFGEYIHLYSQVHYAKNIAQQLISSLPQNVRPDPDFSLAEASNFIEMAYPPYLLRQHGSDLDNMVIFNPVSGIWTHDKDTFYSLLTAIKPYSNEQQLKTFMMTFAAKARNADRFIEPYHGSRYLLFNNCALDVATMTRYELTSQTVRDLHFTDRCHLNIDYLENPMLPQLAGKRQADNGPWNPKDFLMAFANNNPNAYTYLLFGLSLGLFGGHNFGVHFDIQGASRSGKSTFVLIFNKIYDNHTQIIPFPSLNGRFPFTSYDPKTSIIWINECNEGVDPLNDEFGTNIYDNLADNEVRFQVKGKGDMIIENPPQVYIDGTQFIKANELYTGPAGRTLAFKFPTMTDELKAQAYSNAINECLSNDHVIQWLVYNMIMAYKELIPVSRMDDLNLSLGVKQNLDLFPKEALDWRHEFVIGGSSIDTWYENEIEPYISHDPKHPTLLHERVLYSIYLDAYNLANPNDQYHHNAKTSAQVLKRLKTIWNSEDDHYVVNYEIGSIEKGRKTPRKLVASPDNMHFDWAGFEQDYTLPANLEDPGYKQLKLFGKKSTEWLSVYIKDRKSDNQLKAE